MLTDNPRILLTNDDSVHATGFSVLEKIARQLTDDIWVCGPESEQSGASHSLTISRPLRVRKISDQRFACDGTPTDCVLLAVNHLMGDKRPDLVLSGVNHGRNVAEDVTYSGTIAAAMEATLLGIPAIALSQEFRDGPADWTVPEHYGPDVVRHALEVEWPPKVLLNVNFPGVSVDEVRGVRVVAHGNRKIGDELEERIDLRGRRYYWIGTARNDEEIADDTDVQALNDDCISVTPLYLDLSHYATIDALQTAYESLRPKP